jgi:dihydroorotase
MRHLSFLILALTLSGASVPAQDVLDLVLAGGRVMDPESGLDAIRYVGIHRGKIAAISAQPLRGAEVVDVRGLVIAPGFIDLHAHGQDIESSGFQAMDGVTTALELEGGAFPVSEWYEARQGQALIHYGATVSHGEVRSIVLPGRSEKGEDVSYRSATPDEIGEMESLIRQGLDEGALGVGYGIQYMPATTREEIVRVFQAATEERVTNFVHIRFAGQKEPGSSIEAVQEMIANAAALGASIHVVHIGSSGLGQAPIVLDMIEGAQRRGLDVTTEVYPYTAVSTAIESAIFDGDWRERLNADYGDIEWVATGERLDAESFKLYRKQGGMIIGHIIPEETVDLAVAHPLVMIASDGVPFVNGRAHPRGAGTFARILGRYVRVRQSLTLIEALRKMSLLPARRLEDSVPEMRNKGRIRVGADADLAIFDADRVIDRATFEEPAQFSEGFVHVLVSGVFVVRDSQLVEGVTPGQPIRR